MTTKYASYILATIVVLISTHYVYHRASNFIIARRAEAAVHTQHQLSLVTNQVFYADTDLIATVQVLDMQGAPVKADLNVQGIGNDSGATYAFTTDYNGNGTITIPLEKVELDDMDWGWHTLHIEVQSALSTESFFKDINITQSGDTNHIIHFDKGIYAPGDDVLFRILALHSANAQPFAGGQYTISIFDGNDNRVYHENAQTSDFGIISGRFRLADEVNSGFYRLLVERDGFFQSEAFFEVFPYVLPRFEINLETDKTEYTVDEIIYVVGNARYFFDEPVNQGIVNVYINGLPELLDFPLDDNGEFTFSHIAHSPGLVRIWVEVIDNSNHRIETSLSVRVAEGPFEIELMPEHGYLVQDMPNTIYIFTSRADGSPTRAFLQIIGPTFSRQVATDDNGMGMFILEDVREANLISVRAEDLEGNSIEREFFFDGLVRYATLSVNKPRFAMGETIYLSLNSLYPGGTFKIYAYQGDHLLQIITTDTDQAMLHLGDVFGLIDIYAMWMHPSHSFWRHIDLPFTSRTIFVDPGRSMQLSVQSDRPEYRPGEFVNLNIGVTDNSGVPLEAALLVNIVDEAVLSLAANDLSIDNIRLALDGIYFGNGLDAATLYASLIGEASEQTLTRLLLRRGDIEPAIQREWLINELPYAPDTSMSGGAMFLRIYLLLASAILFFALRHSQKNALKAAQSSGQMMRIDDETPTQTIERATVWTVIISVCLFAFALFFLTSCGNASDMAPSTEAPAPMADMAMEAPAAADDFDAAPAPARETPMLTEQAQTPAPAPVTQEDAADFEPVDEPADTAPVTEAEVETQTARVRRLFLETMLFVPELIARDGQANLDFMLADNITTWNIQVVGNTRDGLVGHTESSLRAFQPFFVDFELPRNSIRYDQISIPVTVFNYTEQTQSVILTIAEMDWFTLHVDPVQILTIPSNQSRMVYVPITIDQFGDFVFRAYADTHYYADAAERGLRVNPEGFRIERVVSSGSIESSTWQHLLFIDEDIPDTRRAHIKFYPSAMSQIVEGMENIFRMPTGCFEQTSSILYPNILALRYMQDNNIDNPQLMETALGFISAGYQRILTFEVASERGGFSLYGHAPAETVLTAYGLMQLKDLTSVYTIDERVLDRMAAFLFDSQNSDGSFRLQGWGMDRLSDSDRFSHNAYIAWALSEAFPNDPRLYDTVGYLVSRLDSVDDNYTLALIANTLVNTGSPLAQDVVDQLHDNITRESDMAFVTTTSQDFLGARGFTQDLQATALTSLALSNHGSHAATNALLINYIIAQRDPWGTWHSTQATILCLKALNSHTQSSPLEDGQITVSIGDQQQVIQVSADNTLDFYQISFSGLDRENIIEIDFPNLGRMVYKIALDYFVPYDSVELDRGFEISAQMRTELTVHELVEQDIRIINRSDRMVNNALAAISIPQGFRAEVNSLAALQHRGIIERYEMRFDTINLYLRDIEHGEIIDLTIAYRPSYPVAITGGHMRMFDYYNPSVEGFLEPFEITVRE